MIQNVGGKAKTRQIEYMKETKTEKIPVPSMRSITSKIRSALKSQGTYTRDLEMAISTTAGAYRAFLIAQNDVAVLDKTYYKTESREGNLKYVPHPAIKTMKDTQGMVLDGLKTLGLTLATLNTTDYDPLEKLVDDINMIDR